MAIKDTRQILMETLLDPSSSESDKQAASEAISKLDAAAKPAQKSPIEDTSTDRYFREADAQIKEHLAKEALHPEPIQVLIKCGHQLFAAASAEVRRQNPQTQAGDLDRLVIPMIIEFMNSPESAPKEVRDYIKWGKAARRHLTSVGITWAVGFCDWPFDEKSNPFRDHEAQWYAPEVQGD